MKKHVTCISIGILFLIICYLIYIIRVEQNILKNYAKEINALHKTNTDNTYLLENISIISKLQHYAEGHTLQNHTLYTVKGDSCKLRDLCSEKKLVYYFSEQGCQICYLPFCVKNIG